MCQTTTSNDASCSALSLVEGSFPVTAATPNGRPRSKGLIEALRERILEVDPDGRSVAQRSGKGRRGAHTNELGSSVAKCPIIY
jgi:hypothetical protein